MVTTSARRAPAPRWRWLACWRRSARVEHRGAGVRWRLPELVAAEVGLATLRAVLDALDVVEVTNVLVPADCVDGCCGAYWRRPEAYLDPSVRHAISGFSAVQSAAVERAVRQLAADLADGTWARRNGALLALDELDVGYRLVVASGLR